METEVSRLSRFLATVSARRADEDWMVRTTCSWRADSAVACTTLPAWMERIAAETHTITIARAAVEPNDIQS